eukprot:CAMPEP_0168440852 /NCGR_PEP_ID=MMETSP0228-20121227/43186_1 /TAXON_ID=133427 /ORGANISM="Protoceratium reticulatum, Strain CCCM 535 (=CCMP 1889)" /LENGTH=52 /DNA_ID=CAMNT_0008455155 /DNA_START=111 /DNA_END=266 /DNA_ORIENTATION=+
MASCLVLALAALAPCARADLGTSVWRAAAGAAPVASPPSTAAGVVRMRLEKV